ncbi:acyltransferase family protein [Lacrimispora sp.]|uniref:acyltransferase family protein n=1 Tax=Lacrimispora sp. TaxID=2719234 RepID=UPI0028992290|nr:acyltransferase family protein [Lacrimispora sp.]
MDYLKAISIVLVIITHCGWFNVDNYYPYTASHIKHPLMIFIVDMAVPIFMILSGFTYALSYEKKRSCYYRRWGIVKIVEYTIPMLFVIVENLAINRGRAESIATVIFLGKFGSGAYYFIVLISVVLFFPLIYTLMKDSLKGLIYVGLIQFFLKYYSIFINGMLLIIGFAFFGISFLLHWEYTYIMKK